MSGESKTGLFPWKMQRMFQLPVASVTPRSRESLPAPPEGMEWFQNEMTKEWRLVKIGTTVGIAKEPELITEDKRQLVAPVTPDVKTLRGATTNDQLPPRCGVVDRLPSTGDKINREEDWEFLSDRHSSSSNQTPGVIFHRQNGSIRSLTSMEEYGPIEPGTHNTLSLPFKIQRTASSSTIDSSDNVLGPAGKGVLGVDYVEHVILPSDTLQGICLTYKLSTTRLRQANHFSGNSLLLAPKKLVIPLSKKALRSGFIRVQDTDAKEYKLHAILAEFPDLSMTEAKAYLELADWVLQDAVRSAKDDGEWEREMDNFSFRSGEIRITPKLNKGIPIGFDTKGAGIQPASRNTPKQTIANTLTSMVPHKDKQPKYQPPKVTPYQSVPAIATKSVQAHDIYLAVPQHNNFGVELQPLASSSNTDSSASKL